MISSSFILSKKPIQVCLLILQYFFDKGKVYRSVSRSIGNELFKNPNEKNEIINNWIKMIGYRQLNEIKNLQLYCVTQTKSLEQSVVKYQFERKKMGSLPL
jgi:hypothetical protein